MLNKIKFLVSFWYIVKDERLQGLIDHLGQHCEIFVDSGAFSNFWGRATAIRKGEENQFKPITVEQYIEWLVKHHPKLWNYIAFDVIGEYEPTRRNLESMWAAGLAPVPVFVEGETPDQIEWLTSKNPWLCVAGGMDGKTAYAIQRYQRTKALVGEDRFLHGLGFGHYPEMIGSGLSSGDSSSYTSGGKFGNVTLFYPGSGFKTLHFSEVIEESKAIGEYSTNINTLRSYGLSLSDIRNPAMLRSAYGWPSLVTTYSYLTFSDLLWSKHGIRYFLAVVNLN